MDAERRGGRRHVAWFAIRIDGDELGEAVAISNNVSAKGLLLAAGQPFAVGAPVALTLHLPDRPPREVAGTVVRLEANAADPGGMWPHRLAVELDDPDPALLAELGAESSV